MFLVQSPVSIPAIFERLTFDHDVRIKGKSPAVWDNKPPTERSRSSTASSLHPIAPLLHHTPTSCLIGVSVSDQPTYYSARFVLELWIQWLTHSSHQRREEDAAFLRQEGQKPFKPKLSANKTLHKNNEVQFLCLIPSSMDEEKTKSSPVMEQCNEVMETTIMKHHQNVYH